MTEQPQSWLSNNIKSILAVLVMLSVLGYLYMVTLMVSDPTVRTQALTAMIMLATAIVSYYFGYSQGASKKDEAQATQLANSQTTVVSPAPENPINVNTDTAPKQE